MHVIGIRDSVRIAKNKNGKWWKVIGLIPSLPHLGGEEMILISRAKRQMQISKTDVKKVKRGKDD